MRKSICLAMMVPFLFLIPISSSGKGGEPCGFSLVFDRDEFPSVDEIPIKVKAVCEQMQGKTATVTVSNGDSLEVKDKFFEEKMAVNGFAETKFKVPDSDRYRYLVTVTDGVDIHDRVIIFTEEGASKLMISDLNLPRDLNAGKQYAVEVAVSDGLGNAVPTADAFGTIRYPTCTDAKGYPLNMVHDSIDVYFSPSSSDPYVLTANMKIRVIMPSGTYDMAIEVNGPKGYQYTSTVVQVNVTNDVEVPVTKLFHGVHDANLGVIGRYTSGDTMLLKGKTMSDGCLKEIPNVKIFGELNTTFAKSIVIKNQTKSDNNGDFEIELATDPSMPLNEPIRLTLQATYNSKEYSYEDFLFLQYIERFVFNAGGKKSYAEVLVTSPDTSIVSFTLDKDAKKLTLTTKSPDVANLEIAFPPDLLSGDIVVQKDGNETLVLSGDNYYETLTGSWTNREEGYSLPYLYHISASKKEDHIRIDYRYQRLGESTLEITGTSVIPEFPMSMIIFATAVSLIFVTRLIPNLKIGSG